MTTIDNGLTKGFESEKIHSYQSAILGYLKDHTNSHIEKIETHCRMIFGSKYDQSTFSEAGGQLMDTNMIMDSTLGSDQHTNYKINLVGMFSQCLKEAYALKYELFSPELDNLVKEDIDSVIWKIVIESDIVTENHPPFDETEEEVKEEWVAKAKAFIKRWRHIEKLCESV